MNNLMITDDDNIIQNKNSSESKFKRIWILNDVGQLDYQKYWNYPLIEKLNSQNYFKYMDILGSLGVKIFQSKPFLLKMLSVRGYKVEKQHDNLITQWIIENYNNYSCISTAFKFEKQNFAIDFDNNDTKNTLYLIYYLQMDSFGVDIARNLINYMINKQINNCLLISKHIPTSQVLKEIKSYDNLTIEIWQIEDFLYDWTQIGWVPLHHVMSKNQSEYFLKINNYNKEDLPKLQMSDMMVRYHDLKKNQLVCIQRTEPNLHAYFRIVEK